MQTLRALYSQSFHGEALCGTLRLSKKRAPDHLRSRVHDTIQTWLPKFLSANTKNVSAVFSMWAPAPSSPFGKPPLPPLSSARRGYYLLKRGFLSFPNATSSVSISWIPLTLSSVGSAPPGSMSSPAPPWPGPWSSSQSSSPFPAIFPPPVEAFAAYG